MQKSADINERAEKTHTDTFSLGNRNNLQQSKHFDVSVNQNQNQFIPKN